MTVNAPPSLLESNWTIDRLMAAHRGRVTVQAGPGQLPRDVRRL
jgi:hypothetical protein